MLDILVIVGMILFGGFGFWLVRKWDIIQNKYKNEKNKKIPNDNKNKKTAKLKEYTKESIMDFMEFEKIEDNMIVQKKGKRFLMAIECQGVNYDLMSRVEKVAVEEGFQQFLNTLTHQIQIYIQTRSVNL